ncbi:response regulator [Paenibacillus sp. YN15]|uniref:response regulator n=1 Tax=Paenibacillus sp. YN15 TaxID=1742774 RepID=UPI000DCB011B|nr:response regulator [Paenibacillus sp. YN15]RAV02318.1 DNA-binding response regulator [Paenibacillus sp. YN15]
MYKLVIVDDEPTVRNGLSTLFDWNAYGIELIGQADDGDTGLELIARVEPDIVLTDVKMPSMDGIRMSQEIRKSLPGTKIIFVSGHSDADYLKSALQVYAVDYIFKPVKLPELEKVVERVIQNLQAEDKERTLVKEMQVKLTQSMPLLREKFLMSLVRDEAVQSAGLKEKLAFLNLSLPPEAAYLALLVAVDDQAEVLDTRSERDKQLLSYSVLNIVQELIDLYGKGYAFENRAGEYVGILVLDECREEREAMLLALSGEIRDNLSRWMKISVTIGVGEEVQGIGRLPLSFKRAREAADQKWYLGKNRIITIDSLEAGEEELHRFDTEQSERLRSALKAGDRQRLEAELDDIFLPLMRNRKDGFRYSRYVALQVIPLSGRVLLELNILTKEWDAREKDALDQLFRLEIMADLRHFVASYLGEICTWVQEKRNSRSSNVIERIRAFIDEHYADNLTVADIAGYVYLSQTYVSLLFRQETGETIYEYLMKVRIERAKELLRDPRTKFYEVCQAVGYTDPSYFSKLFKKMTGLTPSAYRDQFY